MPHRQGGGVHDGGAAPAREVRARPIEGHVPAEDIRRLLEERPDAIGLAVPGMPLGSPGMDFGDDREAYDVLLVREDGTSDVFSSYPAN